MELALWSVAVVALLVVRGAPPAQAQGEATTPSSSTTTPTPTTEAVVGSTTEQPTSTSSAAPGQPGCGPPPPWFNFPGHRPPRPPFFGGFRPPFRRPGPQFRKRAGAAAERSAISKNSAHRSAAKSASKGRHSRAKRT